MTDVKSNRNPSRGTHEVHGISPRCRLALTAGLMSLVLLGTNVAQAGAAWTQPVTVVTPASGVDTLYGFDLAVEASGKTTLGWAGTAGALGLRINADDSLTSPFSLAPPEVGCCFDIALSPDGDGAAALPANQFGVIKARSIAADGSLGPVRTLTDAGLGLSSFDIDADGTAAAAWTNTSNPAEWTVNVREMEQDGTLGDLRQLWSKPEAELTVGASPTVAYGSDGTLTAVWAWHNSSQRQMVQARQVSADGAMGPLLDVSALADPGTWLLDGPALAAGPGNSVTVVWERQNGTNLVIESRTIGADGTLGTTHTLASAALPSWPHYLTLGEHLDVEVAPSGIATAIWTRDRAPEDNNPPTVDLVSRTIGPNGDIGTTRVLAEQADEITWPELGVDDEGVATVAWESSFDAGHRALRARQILPNGTLGATQTLATGDSSLGAPFTGRAKLAVAADGNATVVWPAKVNGSTPALRMARFHPGPDTAIDSGPAGLTRIDDPTFAFSSEPGTTFKCSLDGPGTTAGTFAPCASPKSYSGLADGDYTFRVRATDSVGKTDQSPAARSFTVDTVAPKTTFTKKPKKKIKTKLKTETVRTTFSSEAGATFKCRFDNAGYAPCVSPYTVKAKSKGGRGKEHTISVQTTDKAGNVGQPAVADFRVIRTG